MEDPNVLQIDGLSKRFTLHERGVVIDSIQGLDLAVAEGRMTALVGASGSGKSTVLRCVFRSYVPSSGRILFRGGGGEIVDLASASEPEILRLRRRELRLVSQFLRAIPRQPAVQVVARSLLELGRQPDEAHDAAREMLRSMRLPERLWGLAPATFSGGERQLVNLARALVVEPRLVLLDEPTASLDPRSGEQVAAAIEALKGRGIAILAVFHDRAMVERLADEVVEIAGGVGAAA